MTVNGNKGEKRQGKATHNGLCDPELVMSGHRQRFGYFALFMIASILIIFFPTITFADYPDGYYEVGRIIDGDTFELTDGQSVRLIGINTPEVGETCADQATEELTSLISGESVYLEKDVSETDQYGRLLRYVYVDGEFVNESLVYSGYAYAVEYPPDTKYATQLNDAEDDAYSSGRGCLWEDTWVNPCPSGCYVHITSTGSKFHAAGCRYLSDSDISICRDDAIDRGYTACSVCGGSCDGGSRSESDDESGGGGCFISILEPVNVQNIHQLLKSQIGRFVANH